MNNPGEITERRGGIQVTLWDMLSLYPDDHGEIQLVAEGNFDSEGRVGDIWKKNRFGLSQTVPLLNLTASHSPISKNFA